MPFYCRYLLSPHQVLPEYRAEYYSLLERWGLKVDEAELKRTAERRQQNTYKTHQTKRAGGLGLRGRVVAVALWLTKRLSLTGQRQRDSSNSE